MADLVDDSLMGWIGAATAADGIGAIVVWPGEAAAIAGNIRPGEARHGSSVAGRADTRLAGGWVQHRRSTAQQRRVQLRAGYGRHGRDVLCRRNRETQQQAGENQLADMRRGTGGTGPADGPAERHLVVFVYRDCICKWKRQKNAHSAATQGWAVEKRERDSE